MAVETSQNQQNRYNKEYVTVKLPRELVTQCEKLVENSKFGFTSRTDVVKTAIRTFLLDNNGGSNNAILSQPSNDKEIDTNV